MGFGCHGKSLVWKATNLSTKDIKQLYDTGILSHSSVKQQKEKCCKIDVDVSWIVRKLGIGKAEDMIVKEVSLFLRALAHQGPFVVTPVCDGDKRHHSKRAYVDRVSNWLRKSNEGLVARHQYISLEAEIENLKAKGLDQVTEKHWGKKRKFLAESKKMEQDGGKFVPISSSFSSKLQKALQGLKSTEEELDLNGKVDQVLKAQFQADYLIACRRLNGKSDIIFWQILILLH